MTRPILALALLAGVATATVPAEATLRLCQKPVDVGCYSDPHEMHCLAAVLEWCVNLPKDVTKPIT